MDEINTGYGMDEIGVRFNQEIHITINVRIIKIQASNERDVLFVCGIQHNIPLLLNLISTSSFTWNAATGKANVRCYKIKFKKRKLEMAYQM